MHAIQLALEGHEPPRPMTHDLFRDVLDELGVVLERVVDHRAAGERVLRRAAPQRPGRPASVSSRPSDAMALAVRVGSPIFVAEEVLDEAGTSPTRGRGRRDGRAVPGVHRQREPRGLRLLSRSAARAGRRPATSALAGRPGAASCRRPDRRHARLRHPRPRPARRALPDGHDGRPPSASARSASRRRRFKSSRSSSILVGVGTALYAFGVLIETLIEGRLLDHLGGDAWNERSPRCSDHVIVCGWGRVGRAIAVRARRRRRRWS